MNRLAFALVTGLVVLGLATLSFSSSGYAKRNYGRAGCGLGSIVIKPSGNQSSAWSTNGSFGSQTFGITSGTSNCVPTSRNIKAVAQEQFIMTNLSMLAKDMARGEGETLAAFSNVLGCSSGSFAVVAAQLKDSYEDIFAEPGALAVLDASKDRLRENQVIAEDCSYLL